MKSYSVPNGKEDGVLSRGVFVLLLFLGILGTIMVLGAAILYSKVFPEIYRRKVEEALVIKNGSEASERFIKSPVPNYLRFYIFNVTNIDEVNSNGAHPVLRELGPYIFRRDSEKEILEWNEARASVRYKTKLTFFFQPQMSSGKLTDVINHVNAVGLGLVHTFETQPALTALLGETTDNLIAAIRGNLVVTHTVRQLLFDGYSMGEYFPEDYEHLCRLRNNCLFGFYYGKNDTFEKEYEVSTGAKGIASLGRILRYDQETNLHFHFGESCNSINGTDGFMVAPDVTKDDRLYVFVSDVCRSFEFEYSGPSEVEGIPTLRFTIPDHVFIDPNVKRENMCFCQSDNERTPCSYKSGILTLSACKDGNPVFASQPHFLLGEQEYLNDVEGLQPDQNLHQGFLDIEPVTGAVIRGSKKLQINMLVTPDQRVKFLEHQNKTFYFPVFWVEETGTIDSDRAAEFRSRVLVPYLAGKWTLLSGIVLGILLLTMTLTICILKRRTKKQND